MIKKNKQNFVKLKNSKLQYFNKKFLNNNKLQSFFNNDLTFIKKQVLNSRTTNYRDSFNIGVTFLKIDFKLKNNKLECFFGNDLIFLKTEFEFKNNKLQL